MLTGRTRSLSRIALVCGAIALAAPQALSGGHDVIKPGPRIKVENPGRNLSYLNDEQKKIAADMEAFIARMEQKIADAVAPYNRSKEFSLQYGEYEVQVAESEAIEKAGLYTGYSTDGLPPRIDDTYWNAYLHTDLHPRSPLVGLAHITMTLQYITDDTSVVGGNVHVARSAMNEEDIQYVKEQIDAVFEKHGVDITPYREARCDGFRLEHDLTVCAGVSFYFAPLMEANWDNYVLVRDTWEAFTDAIITLAEKRKDDPFTAEDKERQEDMRRWWLRDRLFSDDFTTTVVPFELFSMATLPPEVKF